MTRFLVTSIVLTIVLNLGLRAFPGLQRGLDRALRSLAGGGSDRVGQGGAGSQNPPDGSRWQGRVIFPWKAMIIGSILLTVVANLFLR